LPSDGASYLKAWSEIWGASYLYNDLAALQKDPDDWLGYYNNQRTHQGKMCCGRTPMATLIDGKTVWKKNI